MRIAILSRNPALYSTRRLVEATRARGHSVVVLDPLACAVVVAHRRHELVHGGQPVGRFDAVIPRIGSKTTDHALAVLRHFERAGVPLLNAPDAIARARDKLHALQILSAHDVGMPRTAVAREAAAVRGALAAVGGPPVVIKLQRGTQGVGVMLAESAAAVESLLDTMRGLGQAIVLQEFVREAEGRDLRALVVGGVVVAAMRRQARPGEFRANLHRGGEATAVALDEETARTAALAARVLGLEVAGVDLLESVSGPRVIEVNSSPGLEGLERATGIGAAEAIARRAEALSPAVRRFGLVGRRGGGAWGAATNRGGA